ncbi:MAG: hypothetical protein ACREGL_01750 [Alphaproteobacteria bacterium]
MQKSTGRRGPARRRSGRLTREDVIHVAGELDDLKLGRILATGATMAELEQALAWSQGESDVMGDARQRLTGRVAELYEILAAEEEFEEEPARQ